MGPRSKFVGTNLDSFETNWTLELDLALDLSMRFGSSNRELSFWAPFFFGGGLNQLIFPRKWCHVGLALICHFLVVDPHLKAMGPHYGGYWIGLLYFIGPRTLDPHLKWSFSEVCWNHKHITIAYRAVYEDTNWSWVQKQPLQSACHGNHIGTMFF
jgi:hypothetical protein